MFLQTSLLFVLIPVLIAAPTQQNDADSTIVKYENTNDGSGNYHFRYETSNGISREETGTLINAGQTDAHIEVQGSLSYLGPNGELISVRYSADESGYHILTTDGVVTPAPELVPEVPAPLLASLLGSG